MSTTGWQRVDNNGFPSDDGNCYRICFGGATVIEIEPGGNGGYRADMLLAKNVFLCRGHDLDDVKRRALVIARDKLQSIRDELVVVIGQPKASGQ